MAEYRGFDIFDVFVFILKRKNLLAAVFICSLLFSYAAVYFLIEEQYEASAIIIPAEDDAAAGLGGMLKGLKNIPLNLGKSTTSQSEINRYKTIIYSRTTLESIIRTFDIYKCYKVDTTTVDYKEKTLTRMRKEIIAIDTDDEAFEILVRSNTPQRAADICNFVIQTLNDKIIQLKISKSRENRLFLGKRVDEIYEELRNFEDSLRSYQERSGLIDVKSQLPEMLSVYASLETELMTKELKKNVMKNLFDVQSPEVKNLEMEIKEYGNKLTAMRSERDGGSMVLAMKALPKTALEYYRRFRKVEINSALLEFIVPLYEQAKVEEKRDYPIVQVIDYAVPPSKKTYPPRLLFALLGALFITFGTLFYISVRNAVTQSVNPKVIAIKQELSQLLHFKKK